MGGKAWPGSGANLVFVVVSHTARLEGLARIRGYAGRSGRLDVLVRSLLAASHIPGSAFLGVLDSYEPPRLIYYGGSCGSFGSEREALLEIVRAARGRGSCVALERAWIEEALLDLKRHGYRVYLLHEAGVDYVFLPRFPGYRSAFILGPHIDLPSDRLRELEALCDEKVSIGPVSLLTSHVIAYIGWLAFLKGLESQGTLHP